MREYQTKVNEVLKKNPAVGQFFTLAGLTGRAASSQGLMFAFLKPAGQTPPMETVIGQLSRTSARSRHSAHPAAQSGAADQHRRDQPERGTLCLHAQRHQPGRRVLRRRDAGGEDAEIPRFPTVQSDYFNSTPNLNIDIDRARASLYGVSTTKIESLLRSAYSENYVYLIKQPDDQYQVILETNDDTRAHPEDLSDLYVKADNNVTLVPLKAVTNAHQSVGLQAVNHYNQFTSVTINYNLKPGVADSDASKVIEDGEANPRHDARRAGDVPGRGAGAQQLTHR